MSDWRIIAVIAALVAIAGIEGGLLWSGFFEDGRSYHNKIGTLDTLSLDASRRSIMVHNSGKFCSEPVPDAANTFAKEFALKLSAAAANEKAAANLKEMINLDVLKLFERSQGIQALRDGMYRLCEAFANDAISKPTYEDHIGDLTATLNFIVPLELCAKLNREIVQALTTVSGTTSKPDDTASPAKKDLQNVGAAWPDTFNKSELLTSKFTQACITLGSDFASKLAAQMGSRSLAREAAASVERSLKTPSPGTASSAQPTGSAPMASLDPVPYGAQPAAGASSGAAPPNTNSP